MVGIPAPTGREAAPRLCHQRRVSHALGDGPQSQPPQAEPPSAPPLHATSSDANPRSRSPMESSPKAMRALSIKDAGRREKRDSANATATVATAPTAATVATATTTATADAVSTGSGSGTGSLIGVAVETDDVDEAPTGHAQHHHGQPRVPHKFISNWRHACDKTRDRTRDLLKRWRTAPDGEAAAGDDGDARVRSDSGTSANDAKPEGHGWSVHIWATWVKRLPSDEEGFLAGPSETTGAALLSPVQRDKLTQLYGNLIDTDRDDLVSAHDFAIFSERLRHFADWSNNSAEFHVLRQIEKSFVTTFVNIRPDDTDTDTETIIVGGEPMCSLEQWLSRWGNLIGASRSYRQVPIWLHYFARVMFQVINKSGSGTISRDELSAYYSSVVGLAAQRVGEILDEAYKALTANGDLPLSFSTYRLSFANFVLGRNRNGPGQFLFGPGEPADVRSCPFPIDYSAMNTPAEELEQYSPDRKTNRRSVVV